MATKTQRAALLPYITKDGSEIREFMHPAIHGNQNQSLAEATVPVNGVTLKHCHYRTEELYCISRGQGRMHLGGEVFVVTVGDTVLIPPGTAHYLENTGSEPLVLLCMCSPPYSHEDTVLLSDRGEPQNHA